MRNCPVCSAEEDSNTTWISPYVCHLFANEVLKVTRERFTVKSRSAAKAS